MGGHASALRFKSRSTTDVDRIRPSAEQRLPPKKKGKLSSLAAASRHFAKISFKRKGGNREKIRSFRDLISTWSPEDCEALFREMNAMRQLSELYDSANSARPRVPPLGEQLMAANTHNLNIVFKGEAFPVHSRWLRTRSEFIARMTSPDAAVVELTSPLEGVTVDELREFVRFIYTDSCRLETPTLEKLKKCFAITRPLQEDLEALERRAALEGDFTICLTSTLSEEDAKHSQPGFSVRLDSEIIGARSELLASLVRRKHDDRVVLDESLLPRVLIPLVVHYLYTDQLDLSKISPSAVSLSSLSAARAIVSGQNPDSDLHRASQIVHIAKFFGLSKLVHLCEDVIVSSLSLDSVVSVLTWAEDGGSHYVANMARAYLIREFPRVAASHYLFDLSVGQLDAVLGSHFLQATEVEVLEAAVRWGEHELLRRMEIREPNIVADTSHSISRRGIRRTETSDAELKDILEPIAAHIRTDYILPPFHQSLNSAYRRGILERSPLKDLVVCSSTAEINPDLHWFCPDPQAIGPRFYRPYFEALRSHLAAPEQEYGTSSSGNYAYTTMRSSGSGTATALKIIVINALPEVLDDDTFRSTRQKILSAVEEADAEYAIRFMPRPFHKRTAVEFVVSRVLRELEVHADSVEVRIAEWADSQGSTSTTSSVRLHLHSSQPALHWPDIMTLERRKKVMDAERRGSESIGAVDDADVNSIYDV